MSIADNSDFGILRCIVSDPELAYTKLKEAGFTVKITDVIGMCIPNTPGSLAVVLKHLSDSGVFIEYLYSFSNGDGANVVIRPSNLEECERILEEIKDPSKLDERESYWIDFFHSYIKDGKGYNMTRGGDASNQKGVESTNAKFTQETLNELIDLLQNHRELSLNDLAIKFNVHLDTIRRINNGESYTNSSLHYPIRSNPSQRRLKYLDDYFESEEKLLQLKEDLMYGWDLTIDKDLTKKYNLPIALLRDINNGRRFAEIGDYNYPIRKPNQISHKNPLTREEILEILHLLKDTTVPITKIAEKFKVSRNTIYNINNGTTYLIKDFLYPAREINKR